MVRSAPCATSGAIKRAEARREDASLAMAVPPWVLGSHQGLLSRSALAAAGQLREQLDSERTTGIPDRGGAGMKNAAPVPRNSQAEHLPNSRSVSSVPGRRSLR